MYIYLYNIYERQITKKAQTIINDLSLISALYFFA